MLNDSKSHTTKEIFQEYLRLKKVIEKGDKNCITDILRVINTTNREMYQTITPREYFKNPYLSLDKLLQDFDEMIFYVFKCQSLIVGVVALEVENMDFGKIHSLYVLPEYQKKGIGTALVTHLQNVAQDLGIRKLKLHVGELAVWAINFYRKLGYVNIDMLERTWGITVVMEKEL
jgi:ribosomal protein S18 acetylase RimI-like enzyme